MIGAQVQCFDGSGTRLEFQAQETFGFIPVPDVLMEQAVRNVEVRAKICVNRHSSYPSSVNGHQGSSPEYENQVDSVLVPG